MNFYLVRFNSWITFNQWCQHFWYLLPVIWPESLGYYCTSLAQIFYIAKFQVSAISHQFPAVDAYKEKIFKFKSEFYMQTLNYWLCKEIIRCTCDAESLSDTFWLSLRWFRISFNSIMLLLVQLSMSSLILRTSSQSIKLWFRRSMFSSIFSDTWKK